MKSKKYCFNATIFWKNIRLYWPVWVLYTLLLIMAGPVMLAVEFYNDKLWEEYSDSLTADRLSTLADRMNPDSYILLTAVMAIVVAIFLFSYLTVARNCNMIHSLPVSRRELFLTHVTSGLFMLILPQAASFLISLFICLSNHVTNTTYLLCWFLTNVGYDIFFFALAVFCCFLGAHGLASAFYYGVLNFLYEACYILYHLFIAFFGYGLSSNLSNLWNSRFSFLSPVIFLLENSGNAYTYGKTANGAEVVTAIAVKHPLYALAFAAVGILLFAAAMFLYQRRNLELAGEMVAIPVIRPITRWIVAILAGFAGGYLIYIMLVGFNICPEGPGLFCFIILSSLLGFCVSQMFIRKSFKIFRKKIFLEMAGMLVCVSGLYGLCCLRARAVENYVPAVSQIKSATVGFSYNSVFTGEDASFVTDVQQFLLDHKDEIYSREYEDGYFSDVETTYVTISYVLKDGSKVYRDYTFELNEASRPLVKKLLDYENEPERFSHHLFGDVSDDFSNFVSLTMDFYDLQTDSYYNLDFSQAEQEQLMKALLLDIEDGNLQGYNLYNYDESWFTESSYTSNITVTYKVNVSPSERDGLETIAATDYYQSNGTYYEDAYISFGPRCTHVIEALIETGKIQSEEDIWTWDDYNSYYGYE